jgi:hypothetical protein
LATFPLPQFGGTSVLPNGVTVHGFGQDDDGELYALVTNTSADGTGGIVYKLLPAVHLTIQVNGNNVDITWPVAGGRLQTQTALGGTWVDVPNSTETNHVVVPIDSSNASAYYRLAFP